MLCNGGGCTCSNSSVIVLGSSCLWNHIIYLVWNLHDCFFRALADRYWALVPWEEQRASRGQRALQKDDMVDTWLTRSLMSVCGCYLQVVEDEKQCFCGQSLVEFYRVRVMRWYLMVEGQGGTWVPHQILSEDKQKWGQKFQRTGWRREVSTQRDICTHLQLVFSCIQAAKPERRLSSRAIVSVHSGTNAGTFFLLFSFFL